MTTRLADQPPAAAPAVDPGAHVPSDEERRARRLRWGAARRGPDAAPSAQAEREEPDPRPTPDEVAERYGAQIYTVAYRLTGNPDDAADLAQDVFLRVYRNLHRYEPGTFDGWLYRITKNLFLDSVRRRGRLRTEPLPEEEWRAPASSDPGPADVVERRTLDARLCAGLAGLSEDFRLAVVLCDVQGLTYEEIAATTGWPLGTVRSRIHRGRSQLRDVLARGSGPGATDGIRTARDLYRAPGEPPPGGRGGAGKRAPRAHD